MTGSSWFCSALHEANWSVVSCGRGPEAGEPRAHLCPPERLDGRPERAADAVADAARARDAAEGRRGRFAKRALKSRAEPSRCFFALGGCSRWRQGGTSVQPGISLKPPGTPPRLNTHITSSSKKQRSGTLSETFVQLLLRTLLADSLIWPLSRRPKDEPAVISAC